MGGESRSESRTESEAIVAAVLGETGAEFPRTGDTPLFEPSLPGCCCIVRTVEGVAGERPPTPCGALEVVLAPLSTLICLARGVVSWLPPPAKRCVSDRGAFSLLPLVPGSFSLGLVLLAELDRLRKAPRT